MNNVIVGGRGSLKGYAIRESGGFAIRVLPTGIKTFLYIYSFGEKRKEMNNPAASSRVSVTLVDC